MHESDGVSADVKPRLRSQSTAAWSDGLSCPIRNSILTASLSSGGEIHPFAVSLRKEHLTLYEDAIVIGLSRLVFSVMAVSAGRRSMLDAP